MGLTCVFMCVRVFLVTLVSEYRSDRTPMKDCVDGYFGSGSVSAIL